jgi:hypothetical protein
VSRHDGEKDRSARSAAGDVAEDVAEAATGVRRGKNSQHLQQEAPDPSAEDSGERVAERTEALVLHRGASHVAADGATDQTDEKTRHVHGNTSKSDA